MSDRLTPERFRVGEKVPLNVYEGDRPMFQCHTPEDAARIVGLLNQSLSAYEQLRRDLAESEKKLGEFQAYNCELDITPPESSDPNRILHGSTEAIEFLYKELSRLRESEQKYAESERLRKEAEQNEADLVGALRQIHELTDNSAMREAWMIADNALVVESSQLALDRAKKLERLRIAVQQIRQYTASSTDRTYLVDASRELAAAAAAIWGNL